MVRSIKVADLDTLFRGSEQNFIGRVSFEERSLVVPRALQGSKLGRCLIFISTERSQLAEYNFSEFKNCFPTAQIVEIDIKDPISTAQRMFNALKHFGNFSRSGEILIDITSFRREELLMLLAVLRFLPSSLAEGNFVYISAGQMAPDWISRNVVAHRSVVGYAGEMKPSRSTCLVLLMGFEVDRARSIVDNYEPSEIILGVGRRSESINEQLFERNISFAKEIQLKFDNVSTSFEFSARDPLQVADELEEVISLSSLKSNVIISPLHTKLSTLGAGLYAQKHPEVQICYAAMKDYNEHGYSTVGKDAFLVTIGEFL